MQRVCTALLALLLTAALVLPMSAAPAFAEEADTPVALSIGSRDFSLGEANFYYANEYYYYLNQFGSYAMMFGLDTSTGLEGLDEQYCMMLPDGSWKDYFLNYAQDYMRETAALVAYADENGISLDEKDLAGVEESLASVDAYAAAYGYSDTDAMFEHDYGKGVNREVYRQVLLDTTLAGKVYNMVEEDLAFSPEELETYYRSLDGEKDKFSCMRFQIPAALDEGETVASAAALADARADAEAVEAVYAADSETEPTARFSAALDACFPGVEPAISLRIDGSGLEPEERAWLMEPDREPGDLTILDGDTGCTLLVFLDYSDNHYPTVSVRHILVMAEPDTNGIYTDEAKAAARALAEEILAEYEAGEQTEEAFAALAAQYSEDSGSNQNGGLYMDIYKGQMVPDFDAFCFEGHEPGDTGIVYGENDSYAGYHVMYFVGEGELRSSMIAANDLRSSYMQNWLEELTAPYEIVPGPAFGEIG